MAGWSSNSKYAILGGFRSAAQLVSYEIPLILGALSVVMLAGSMRFTDVVDAQASVPYIALAPLAFAVFFIAGLAEVGRTPFDIYFAESEVVGGPFVEYSGAHWAVFFLAEYVNTFVVAALGALLFLAAGRGRSAILGRRRRSRCSSARRICSRSSSSGCGRRSRACG